MHTLRSFPFLTLTLFLTYTGLYSTEQDTPKPNPSDIRIVAVIPTPESAGVKTRIIFPESKDFIKSNPVRVQIRVDGFPLRTYSQFARAKEVLNYTEEGQSLHIIVDNQPYFIKNEAIVNSLQEVDIYYEQALEFNLPMELSPGQHLLRVFPARSYGESLKAPGCFDTRLFYVDSKTPLIDITLNKPYLTYNQPQGHCKYQKDKPLLLDFYISNTQLSSDGYKVRLTLDRSIVRILTKWVPYYIYGLKEGNHTCKIELLDETNKVVPGPFNAIEREFCIR